MHIYCFGFSWAYLILIHSEILDIPWQMIPIHMVITLRLVGLSFEVNTSHISKNRHKINHKEYGVNDDIIKLITPSEELTEDPGLHDILFYTFNFIGIHRGN